MWRIIEGIKKFIRKCRYTYQQVRWGFSEDDLWAVDNHLALHIANILEYFVANHTGHPNIYSEDEFNAKILRIASAFRAYLEIDKKRCKAENELIEAYIAPTSQMTFEEYRDRTEQIIEQFDAEEKECYKVMRELFGDDGFFAELFD